MNGITPKESLSDLCKRKIREAAESIDTAQLADDVERPIVPERIGDYLGLD